MGISSTLKKIGRPFERLGHKIQRETKRLGRDITIPFEQMGHKIQRETKRLGRDITIPFEQAFDTLKSPEKKPTDPLPTVESGRPGDRRGLRQRRRGVGRAGTVVAGDLIPISTGRSLLG